MNVNRQVIEYVEECLTVVRGEPDWGGIDVVILAGDYKQLPPVIKGGSRN